MNNILNITILNNYIHNVFVAEEMLQNIQICGEVTNLKISGKHIYFDLKDDNAQIGCCCFNYAKTYLPKNGEAVILFGGVNFYTARGTVSFIAQKIQSIGVGLLAVQLEQLKQKLKSLGYFDEKYKKPIPKYCKNICVITSIQGAVIRDIVSTIRSKNNIINIIVYDVKVQGKDCSSDVAKALKHADKQGFDVVVIARGGGSLEDLWGYNNENLVKTIFDCTTPIISAIGHETDWTLCDFVADYRALTPTASAEYLAYNNTLMVEEINKNLQKMKLQLGSMLQNNIKNLNNVKNQINKNMMYITQSKLDRLKHLDKDIKVSIKKLMVNSHNKLSLVATKINNLNPMNLLSKGYWQVTKQNDIITKVSQLSKNDLITLKGNEGEITAQITEVKYEI